MKIFIFGRKSEKVDLIYDKLNILGYKVFFNEKFDNLLENNFNILFIDGDECFNYFIKDNNINLVMEIRELDTKEIVDIVIDLIGSPFMRKVVLLNPRNLYLNTERDNECVLVEIIDNKFYVSSGTSLVEESIRNGDNFISVKIIA